jgi:hypothetical protein
LGFPEQREHDASYGGGDMPEAEKYASRSEPLAALMATAKGALEQARAAEAK